MIWDGKTINKITPENSDDNVKSFQREFMELTQKYGIETCIMHINFAGHGINMCYGNFEELKLSIYSLALTVRNCYSYNEADGTIELKGKK